jgi:hypothetical protein
MPFGVLGYLRQTVKSHQNGSWIEQGSALVLFVVRPGTAPERLEGPEKADLVHTLAQATIRTKPESNRALLQAMCEHEMPLAQQLRRPTETELAEGVRHAVSPLLAMTVAHEA